LCIFLNKAAKKEAPPKQEVVSKEEGAKKQTRYFVI
jgi:hypothetical protein